MKKLKDGVYTQVTSATNAAPVARWLKKGDKNFVEISEEEFAALSSQADLADSQSDRERRGTQRILDEKRRDMETEPKAVVVDAAAVAAVAEAAEVVVENPGRNMDPSRGRFARRTTGTGKQRGPCGSSRRTKQSTCRSSKPRIWRRSTPVAEVSSYTYNYYQKHKSSSPRNSLTKNAN